MPSGEARRRVQLLDASPPNSSSFEPCFRVWSQLLEAFDEDFNLTGSYQYRPEHLGSFLTLSFGNVSNSSIVGGCRISALPFKPLAFVFLLTVAIVSAIGNVAVLAELLGCCRRRRSSGCCRCCTTAPSTGSGSASARGIGSKMSFFIMHLAAADLVVLLTPLVELVNIWSGSWYGGRHLCKLYRVLSTFGLYLSSFIVVAIAMDRCAAITRPFSIATARRRARLMLTACLVAAVACSLPQAAVFDIFESSFFQSHNPVCMEIFAAELESSFKRRLYNIFAFVMMYGLPLIVIIVCYSSILCVLTAKSHRQQQQPNQQQQQQSSSELHQLQDIENIQSVRRSDDARAIRRARSLTLKMSIIIVLAFLLCWAPHWSATLWITFASGGHISGQNDSDIIYMCRTFAFFNSAINPLIYGVFTNQCQARLPSLQSEMSAPGSSPGWHSNGPDVACWT